MSCPLDCYHADLADALTLAAEGLLHEAAEVLDLGLSTVENSPDEDEEPLIERYRFAYVALRETYPEFATAIAPCPEQAPYLGSAAGMFNRWMNE